MKENDFSITQTLLTADRQKIVLTYAPYQQAGVFVYLYDGNKVDGIKPENCPKMLRDINSVEMFISYIAAAKYYGKTNIFNDGCSILYLEPFLHAGVTNLINKGAFESQDPEFWCKQGKIFYNSAQYNEVLNCCNKAIILDPNCFEAWHIQSCVYHHHLNMLTEALDCYNNAIASYSQILKDEQVATMLYHNKGDILKRLGNTEEALVCFTQAINIYPWAHINYIEKSKILVNLDRSEEALACLNVAIPLLCDAHKAEIYYQTGLILQSLNKHEESLICFDQAINSKPNFLDAYKEKIHSLYTLIPIEKNQSNKENQLKETLVCLNKMTNLVSNSDKVKIDNEEVKALCVLGYTSYKLNKYEQAIDSYKKAIEINNDFQMAHYGLEIANEALSIALIGIDPEI